MINTFKKFMRGGFAGTLSAGLYCVWIPSVKAYFYGTPAITVMPEYAVLYLFNFVFFITGFLILELLDKKK